MNRFLWAYAVRTRDQAIGFEEESITDKALFAQLIQQSLLSALGRVLSPLSLVRLLMAPTIYYCPLPITVIKLLCDVNHRRNKLRVSREKTHC